MLNKLRGKTSLDAYQLLDAMDSRGLEVVEGDPETSWSLWDSALAEQDSRYSGMSPATSAAPLTAPAQSGGRKHGEQMAAQHFPDFEDVETQPMGLEALSTTQRAAEALEIVELFHHRVANTIRTLWGYNECSLYINKLIMNGGDGMGDARVGFNAEAAQAMLVLADLHDQQFGGVGNELPSAFSGALQANFAASR